METIEIEQNSEKIVEVKQYKNEIINQENYFYLMKLEKGEFSKCQVAEKDMHKSLVLVNLDTVGAFSEKEVIEILYNE